MGGLVVPPPGYGQGRFPPASKLTGIQRGINEETRVLFYDKRKLAYICRSDKAVAGHVNRFATFPAVSYDTVRGKAMECSVGMKIVGKGVTSCLFVYFLFHLAS